MPSSQHLPSAGDRRARKRERTADHLVQVAFDLFERHGYLSVTMEQIAQAADVAKGTLYNHFPVKEALVRHRMHHDLARALPRLFAAFPPEAGCAERLRLFLRESARYTLAAREYVPHYLRYRVAQGPLAEDEGRSGLNKVYTHLLTEGQARGEIAADPPAEVLADMLGHLHLSALTRWLTTPGLELEAAFGQMLDLFLKGCGREERP